MQSHDLIVPVLSQTLETILSGNEDSMKAILESVSTDELLGLLALQNLSNVLSEGGSVAPMQRTLAGSFDLAQESNDVGFRKEVLALFERKSLVSGIKAMREAKVGFVNQGTLDKRTYLDDSGKWDYSFITTYKSEALAPYPFSTATDSFHLGDEQCRIITVIGADIDEPIHMEGYAGSGKTHIVRAVLSLLDDRHVKPENILLLAYTINQARALTAKLPSQYITRGHTFGFMAQRMLPNDFRHLKQALKAYPLNPNDVIRYFGLQTTAGMSSKEIVTAITSTVYKFCHSAECAVCEDHLPVKIKKWTRGGYHESGILKQLVVRSAQEFWNKVIDCKNRDLPIPGRYYYCIKLASLLRCQFPTHCSHVLIDEAHDLSQPMRQIIENSSCCCISLGDRYQNLAGTFQRREKVTRELEMSRSFRAGRGLEQLINPILSSHPLAQTNSFSGSQELFTAVEYYQKAKVPDSAFTILVSDEWALWEWAQRLTSERCCFRLISRESELTAFVEGVVKLKQNNIRPSHRLLYRFGDWDSLVEAYEHNMSFLRIVALLDKNYSLDDWMTSKKLMVNDGTAAYTLGMASDSRNMEFNRLMLTPDIVSLTGGKRFELSKLRSTLYVAITRVKYELLAPISLREWVEEITGRQNKIHEINK
jgi:hypothetical protein